MRGCFIIWFSVLITVFTASCTTGAVKREQERDAKNAALLAKHVESTDLAFVNGKKFLEDEKFEEALGEFEKSSYSQAIFFRAVILQNKGETEESKALFKECIEKNILKAESYYNLALMAYDSEEIQFEEYIDSALKSSPEHIPSLYFKGNIHFINMELDKALEYYKKALKVDPHKTELWDAVFTVKLQKGEYGECWKLRNKVELVNPVILSNLLKIGQMLGHYDEAIALIPDSLVKDLSIRQERRIMLTRSGKIKEAITMANEDIASKEGLDYAVIDRGGDSGSGYLLIQRNDGILYLLCAKDQGKETPVAIGENSVTVNGFSRSVPLSDISAFSKKTCESSM